MTAPGCLARGTTWRMRSKSFAIYIYTGFVISVHVNLKGGFKTSYPIKGVQNDGFLSKVLIQ